MGEGMTKQSQKAKVQMNQKIHQNRKSMFSMTKHKNPSSMFLTIINNKVHPIFYQKVPPIHPKQNAPQKRDFLFHHSLALTKSQFPRLGVGRVTKEWPPSTSTTLRTHRGAMPDA